MKPSERMAQPGPTAKIGIAELESPQCGCGQRMMAQDDSQGAPTEGRKKGGPGRPKIVIDWELVQKLAHIQCTQAEIATAVGVSVDTLHRHAEFAEVYKRGSEAGKKSLRRMQFESATKGNIAMQIWLGKQYLGQRDNLDQRVNTELQIRADYSKLDDAELAELERLTNKAYAQTIDVTPAALPAVPDEQVSTGDQTQEREGEPTPPAFFGASDELPKS